MVRVTGVNIPDSKRVEISLCYIYGIGVFRAREICSALNIPVQKRAKDLTEPEISMIQDYIATHYIVEGDLHRKHYSDIKHLMDIKCYRGLRHRNHLPVHGQRTRSNANTARRRSRS